MKSIIIIFATLAAYAIASPLQAPEYQANADPPTPFESCTTALISGSMKDVDLKRVFNQTTWYADSYDKAWLANIMGMNMKMPCVRYINEWNETVDGKTSVNTTLDMKMADKQFIQYQKMDNNVLKSELDGGVNQLAVLFTDYEHVSVFVGCNQTKGGYWAILSNNETQLNETCRVDMLDKINKLNPSIGNPIFNAKYPNIFLQGDNTCGAAQVTAMSALLLTILGMLSSWIVS